LWQEQANKSRKRKSVFDEMQASERGMCMWQLKQIERTSTERVTGHEGAGKKKRGGVTEKQGQHRNREGLMKCSWV